MCEALQGLLENEAERSRIGEKARAFAVTQYSAIEAAKRYLELCGTSLQTAKNLLGEEKAC